MDNVTYIDVQQMNQETITFAIIDKGNDEFISMPKSVYDTLPSNSSIPQAGE